MLGEVLPVGLTLRVNHEGPPSTAGHHDCIVNRQAVIWQALHHNHDQHVHYRQTTGCNSAAVTFVVDKGLIHVCCDAV